MNDKTIVKRNNAFSAVLMGIFICVALFIASINIFIAPPITREADVFEGKFYSVDEVELTIRKEKDSTLFAEDQHAASLVFPIQYGHLLGYSSYTSGKSGLRERFRNYLYDGEKVGKDIELTINHEIQMKCFDVLDELQRDGSVVVLDNDTGRILGLVSTKESAYFDANRIDDIDFEKISESYLLKPEWEICTKPGSTFKVITGIGLYESDLEDYVFYDEKGYVEVGDAQIYNAGHTAYGQLDLSKAIKVSSNTYFVSALKENETLYDSVKTVCDRFRIGADIELDFCTLSSDFIYADDEFSRALTMFGQGDVYITPVHNSMIFSSIASGKLMKPYVVATNTERTFFDRLMNRNKTVKPVVLEKDVIRDAEDIRDSLALAAENYGFKAGFYAKTGTAELNDDGTLYQFWLCVANSDFTVVISTTGEYGYSSDLIAPMQEIIAFVETKY